MYDFPWTDSGDFIVVRHNEIFLQRGKGDLKVAFSLPINWIDEFDIFSNLRLQEPFGLDGRSIPEEQRGEVGRYYYIESLTYDFMNQKINIVAIDMQFILRQVMIVPACGDVPETWAEASELDKMYAYVGNCATNSFVSDGSPLKRIAPCAVCE